MLKKTTKKKRNTNSKSKQKTQKHKRLKTFHDSNCSLLQDGTNPASISDLFKNQALKKKHQPIANSSQINFSSTINNYTSVYTVISSIHPQKVQKTKSSKNITKPLGQTQKKKVPQKAKSKSKLIPQASKQTKKKKQHLKQQQQKQQKHSQKLQSYQLIPQSKNSLNSQIVFSIQETKRESDWQQKRRQQSSRIHDSLARISQENLVNNNRLLRSTIKQEFKRKNEAATKIQKVFRGYLTRKILQKYIREEQQKLYGLLQNYKSSTVNKPNSSIQKSKRSNYDMQFFSNRTHSKQYSPKSKQYSPKTFQDQESINLSKVNPSNYRLDESKVSSERVHSNRFFNQRQNEIVNCENQLMSSSEIDDDQGYYECEQDGISHNSGDQQQQQEQQHNYLQQASDQQSQSSEQVIAYRHQQVIYNSSQIQQYLQSSSQEQDATNIDKKLPQIIFETNEQHIESRKNSLLNKDQPTNHIKIKNIKTQTFATNETSDIIFYEPQEYHNFIETNQAEQFIDQDLIKTSKVNSIHNHSQSQKGSIKSSYAVSPRTKKDMIDAEINEIQQPSERTSKKQCKKVFSIKKPLNITVNSNSSIQGQKNQPNINPSAHQQNAQHLNTIKLSVAQKYSPPNPNSKQAFMDTISYNSQFKAKHQITTPEQISKRKDSMKKNKIYYFSDESDHVDNQKDNDPTQHKIYTPSSSRKSQNKNASPNDLERLKNLEMQRWDEVIRLMNCQLKDMTQTPSKSKQFQCFIKQVMDLSLKNKQILKQMISQQNSFNKSHLTTFKNSRIDQMLQQKDSQDNQQKLKKWKDFKQTLSSGRRKSITEQDIAVFKPNSRILLANKHQQKQPLQNNYINSPKSKTFFMQPKLQLKQKLNKIQSENFNLSQPQTKQFTLMNFQNDQIQQMLKIRQQMLEKRQCQELTKLNQKLIKKELTQKQFLHQLKLLTDAFQLQKQSIGKARQDISKGYTAAVKLIKEAFCDAKKIGYKLPLSKSSDSYKLNKHLGFGVLTELNNIIIDQMNSKDHSFAMKHKKEKSVKNDHEHDVNVIAKQTNQPNIDKSQRLSALQAQYIEQKQFTRSQAPQPLNILSNNSNNFSLSSQSIINNLNQSQNSFKDHYFDTEVSPKHQAIVQTPQSCIKSNIFMGNDHEFDDMSEQSSEIQFSEEQLKRFRKAQPYDPSIADMNRNLMIGKDFFEMQKFSNEYQSHNDNDAIANDEDPENLRMRLYREVYEIEENSMDSAAQQFSLTKPRDPKIQLIAEKQLQFLIFEISTELLMKPLFSQKFLQPKRQQMFGIRKVSDDCRKDFIRMVQNLMPNKQQIFAKINQNISPLPKQLLKCMRIDFSQDQQQDNDEQYEQIGKYEMILDQEMCNLAIEKYHQRMTQEKQNKLQVQLLTGDNLHSIKQDFQGLWGQHQEKVFGYIDQRQKFVSNRKQHCQSIRWQFINMQLHCLFDAWNQQIIQLKNNHTGFSGIGLNQLSLSMIDRNKKINQSQVQQIIQLSKFKLMKLLNYQQDIISEINSQVCRQMNSQSQVSTNSLQDKIQFSWHQFSWVYVPNKDVDDQLDTEEESRWVYYADEALSYGLELVYLIEEELFSDLAKDLRKLTIKANFW